MRQAAAVEAARAEEESEEQEDQEEAAAPLMAAAEAETDSSASGWHTREQVRGAYDCFVTALHVGWLGYPRPLEALTRLGK